MGSGRAASIAQEAYLQQGSIPIRNGTHDTETKERPHRSLELQSFQISYEYGQNLLLVSSSIDVGLVYAVIENHSTGTVFPYTFISSEPAVLPISEEDGLWELVLYCANGRFSFFFTSY